MMIEESNDYKFPGGSKSRVNRAGDAVRREIETKEDLATIEDWRRAHSKVINTFQSLLRSKKTSFIIKENIKDEEITVAQRLKRKETIFNKLKRYENMNLSRMDDVAGCRIIFPNIESLRLFRDEFHKSKFKHIMKNEKDKYDYIENPKKSGYRGIHDIYEYNVNSKKNKYLKGLLIELQYRTKTQHAWATTVEIFDMILKNKPETQMKFNLGNQEHQYAMCLASEILSRSEENLLGPIPSLSNRELIECFVEVEKKTKIIESLNKLSPENQSENNFKGRYNILVLDDKTEDSMSNKKFSIDIYSHKVMTTALSKLFELEKNNPDLNIVFTTSSDFGSVKNAYSNYFSDPSVFVNLIEKGCNKLSDSKTKIIKM
jgi:putative GTP pyrophosphokinase